MALSVSLHNEAAVELIDLTDQEYFSDVTNTGESDQEDFASVPRAFEQVVPRNLKRTYGVLVDSSSLVPERRLRTRVDEQLELLRAILPNSCTDEKVSILRDTYEYIEKLQRQVNDLHYELDTDSCTDVSDESSSDRLSDFTSSSQASLDSQCDHSQPTIEVAWTDEGLKIHIECEKRPGLLVNIMKLLESSGLNVEQASIACFDHLVFEGIGSETEATSSSQEGSSLSSPVSAEGVRASLVSLITTTHNRLGSRL